MSIHKKILLCGASAALAFSACVFAIGGDDAVQSDSSDKKSNATTQNAAEGNAESSDKPGIATAEKPAKAAVEKSGRAAEKPVAVEKPKRPLTEGQIALRDELRQVLGAYRQAGFNTQQNTATEIQGVCWAYGCDAEVTLAGEENRRINGITALCWNYPCNGFEMLAYRQRHIAPRIGYGYQENQGEFLAMLAMSRVPATYPIRVGRDVRKVSDVVAAEKLACREDVDASLRLVALSYYVDEDGWKNDLGETWSVDRIVGEELKRSSSSGNEAGINRLLGLSCAVKIQLHRGETLSANLQRANQYIGDFQKYAILMQNSDGTWGPMFLTSRSEGAADISSKIRATSRILEWLAISLSDDSLQHPRVVAAVDVVARLLSTQEFQNSAPSLSTRSIVSLGHALHALSVYDDRVFKPYDSAEKPADKSAEKAADEQASAGRPTVR